MRKVVVSQSLQWKLFIKKRASATQGVPPGKDDLKWVANTTTLIYGQQDALLVDTFLSDVQTDELANWIDTTGKRLTAIYITHGHTDHFFGLNLLRERFPSARAVALPQVVEAMRKALAVESIETWKRRFPGQIPGRLVAAEALDHGSFSLEDNAIEAVNIGHTDTDHTTCLHVPSIGLVVAGDAIYNGTHPYLVESDRQGLIDWLAAIDIIEALDPRSVVVGHGPLEPDNSPRHIQETRRSIQDFMR